jgi:hypothetical protein
MHGRDDTSSAVRIRLGEGFPERGTASGRATGQASRRKPSQRTSTPFGSQWLVSHEPGPRRCVASMLQDVPATERSPRDKSAGWYPRGMRWVAALPLFSGCAPGPVAAPPSTNPAFIDGVPVRMGPDDVDVLYVVDDSPSMQSFGATSCLGNPTMISGLGETEAAIGTLRVGFISSDMGADVALPTCEDPDGDDGVLLHEPSELSSGCDASYPRFLTWRADDPDPGFSTDFACLESMESGCGWEQPLAAIEKALGPHSAPGGPNWGFLREDSLLVVVVVTNEDDCSLAAPSAFHWSDDSFGPANLACFSHPELLRPVGELVEAMLALRSPGRIAVAAIAGLPPGYTGIDSEEDGDVMTPQDMDAILADDAMQARIDDSPEGGGNRLVPSCDIPGLRTSYPPRRIVEWVRALDAGGAAGLVQSLCDPDMAPVDRALGALVRSRLRGGGCLGELLRDAGGRALETAEHADCTLFETLADGGDCGAGRIREGTTDGRTVCRVCQSGDPAPCEAVAWSYARDPFCGGAGRILFDPDLAPAPDSDVRLRCP